MLISELIKELEGYKSVYGDIEVRTNSIIPNHRKGKTDSMTQYDIYTKEYKGKTVLIIDA